MLITSQVNAQAGTEGSTPAVEAVATKPVLWLRYRVATLFTILLGFYFVADTWAKLAVHDANALFVAQWTIDIVSWTVSSLGACVTCWLLARGMPAAERRTWYLIGFGCCCWFVARLIWDINDGRYYYSNGTIGKSLVTPHWTQLLFAQYPVWITIGVLMLPKPATSPLTFRQLANVGLLICTLTSILVFTIFEPAAQNQRSLGLLSALLIHGLWYPIAALTVLHLVWTYRWQEAHWPLVLLVVAMAFHVVAFFAGAQRFIAGDVDPLNWSRAMSSLSFMFVACAANEHALALRRGRQLNSDNLLTRERWLEAVMPGILMATSTFAAVVNVRWVTPRSMMQIGITGFAFCIILSLREWWMQREELRLLRELRASHDDLLAANAELSRSEQLVRALNTDLEQRVAERTQALQTAYRELETFSYAVAHDIKAPLRSVHAYGTLLVEEFGPKLEPRAVSYVERIRSSVAQAAHLVDDLLAYARIERVELKTRPTSLSEIVHVCVEEQADDIQRGHAIIDIDVLDVRVLADRSALTQAVRNLLQNALKFSRNSSPPCIRIVAVSLEGHVRLSVADNGIGFDMQYAEQIFRLFHRLHRADEYPGTGIGLAIARKAVERMGGKLWAESTEGQGTEFHLELPCDN